MEARRHILVGADEFFQGTEDQQTVSELNEVSRKDTYGDGGEEI